MKSQAPETKASKVPVTRRRKVSYTIGFRVDAHTLSQLEKGASHYGISVHDYARQRLMELLDRQDEARLLEAATDTRNSVEGLRDDLAASIEILLGNVMPGTPEEKAARAPKIRAVLNEHLRRDRDVSED